MNEDIQWWGIFWLGVSGALMAIHAAWSAF